MGVTAIFWTINNSPGFQGLKDGDRGSCGPFLDQKRPTRTPRVNVTHQINEKQNTTLCLFGYSFFFFLTPKRRGWGSYIHFWTIKDPTELQVLK